MLREKFSGVFSQHHQLFVLSSYSSSLFWPVCWIPFFFAPLEQEVEVISRVMAEGYRECMLLLGA
ncbi:hypothetical protein ACMX02_00755 [Bartonella bacilliformis]|uniref:Uncharacterized protein n=1 Tax=Bartonella bacilliformis (strain ATCC 35685 / KC583 / Herrer 020/F12,63) TaxID=360095 RepID=A1URB0_BARBK|nr:hypothetical protein BARBAKC583_0175 [Bartonella bacilliformis KC583]AMG85392.1 hypothetical protein AL467_00985 [Bartonella bacilliformis]KZN22123.1 hypothetical protein A6B38_00165 [Bartonella bacilliformis]QFZ89989.1 hypothetical protein GHC17_00795 [Bartonella bacilliformis]